MDQLALKIYKTSYLTGSFKLRSGKISDYYFDKYLFESYPELLKEVTNQMVKLIPEGTEILAGLEMGGIPIATALSLETGIPLVFVRKEAKQYGTCKLAEGIDIGGKNVCIVEDVVTTGGQILLSAMELRDIGANIQNIMCVIERSQEGRENLVNSGFELISLFKMEQILQTVKGEG